jgi:hypothetical protein
VRQGDNRNLFKISWKDGFFHNRTSRRQTEGQWQGLPVRGEDLRNTPCRKTTGAFRRDSGGVAGANSVPGHRLATVAQATPLHRAPSQMTGRLLGEAAIPMRQIKTLWAAGGRVRRSLCRLSDGRGGRLAPPDGGACGRQPLRAFFQILSSRTRSRTASSHELGQVEML